MLLPLQHLNVYYFFSIFLLYKNMTFCFQIFLDFEDTTRRFQEYTLVCSTGTSLCGKLLLIMLLTMDSMVSDDLYCLCLGIPFSVIGGEW